MSKVNETTGTTKVFKNPDCVRCELGIDVEEESFHCYNPFLRRKSEGITSGRQQTCLSLRNPRLYSETSDNATQDGSADKRLTEADIRESMGVMNASFQENFDS